MPSKILTAWRQSVTRQRKMGVLKSFKLRSVGEGPVCLGG